MGSMVLGWNVMKLLGGRMVSWVLGGVDVSGDEE